MECVLIGRQLLEYKVWECNWKGHGKDGSEMGKHGSAIVGAGRMRVCRNGLMGKMEQMGQGHGKGFQVFMFLPRIQKKVYEGDV